VTLAGTSLSGLMPSNYNLASTNAALANITKFIYRMK
jgi:hypothetical protein